MQKELQSKLLRLHQKLSAELANNESTDNQGGWSSWQRRTWKDNCDEIQQKCKVWSVEVHEIEGD